VEDALGAHRQAEDRGHRSAHTGSGWKTCDDEFIAAAEDFIRKQEKANKPWFVWLNTTHMHLFTHTKKKSIGQAGTQAVALSRHHDRS
jgi:hypothetical protein